MIIQTAHIKDIRADLEQEWIDGVTRSIERGKKLFTGDFYVQVVNVLRTRNKIKGPVPLFYERQTCPTPVFDGVVYKYYRTAEDVKLLWCLPNKDVALNYYHNKNKVHPDEYHILSDVLKYFDGSLFNLVDSMELEDGRLIN